MTIPYSQSMKEDTKWRLLNLGFNIKDNILCVFFSYISIKERKESKSLHIFFLMLQAKVINSIATLESSFIKVLNEGSPFNFKFMDMAK